MFQTHLVSPSSSLFDQLLLLSFPQLITHKNWSDNVSPLNCKETPFAARCLRQKAISVSPVVSSFSSFLPKKGRGKIRAKPERLLRAQFSHFSSRKYLLLRHLLRFSLLILFPFLRSDRSFREYSPDPCYICSLPLPRCSPINLRPKRYTQKAAKGLVLAFSIRNKWKSGGG